MTAEKSRRRAGIPALLPAAAWYGLIWFFSGQTAASSGALSDRFLYRLLEAVSPSFARAGLPAQAAAVELLSFFERKAAHMFLYFVLALLLCFATRFFTRPAWRRVGLSFLLCALLAGLDEYHQTMVPGRSGEARDVLVDLCGAGIALLFLSLPRLAARRRQPVPLPALLPAGACLLPALLAAAGTEAVAASPLLPYGAARFVSETGGAVTAALLGALAPVAWDALYLTACGIAGVCAPTAALLAGAGPRGAVAAGAAVTAAAALLSAAGAVSPLAAACLTLLGGLGAGALWALGTVLLPSRRQAA